MASTYLTRTLGTPTSQRIFTISAWIKRGELTAHNYIIGQNSTNESYFRINSSDQLDFQDRDSGTGASDFALTTNALLRDVSAWYHVVLSVDTTQATASDRGKLYINGELQTLSASTYPPQNYDTMMNLSGATQKIGYVFDFFDGSMAHVHFIDGTQYAASDFGETDATTGIWKPKTAPSVTYGNNGFFLKFENSGSMGTDSSGNGNNFTVNGNLTQNIDTPSNVFATLNPLQSNNAKDAVTAPSNGNLTFNDTNNADWRTMIGTLGVSSGKWYWEVKATSLSGSGMIGVGRQDYVSTTLNKISNAYTGSNSGDYSFSYRENGTYYYNGTSSGSHTTFTTGNIVMIALDMDNGAIYTGVNGTWNDSGDPTSGASKTGASYTGIQTGEFYNPSVSASASNAQLSHNFGNGYFGTTAVASAQNPDDGIGIFEYDVPTGYRALCTKSINAEEYS